MAAILVAFSTVFAISCAVLSAKFICLRKANPNVKQSPRRGDDSCFLRGPHQNGGKLRCDKLGTISTILQLLIVKRTPFSVFLSERNSLLLIS